jgi:hypothetical protein
MVIIKVIQRDLGKPECNRCIKRCTPCPGYDENRNILHHKLVSQHTPRGKTIRPVARYAEQFEPLASPFEINMGAEIRTQIFSGYMNTLFTHNTFLNGKEDSWYLSMTRFPSIASESELVDRSVIALAATVLANRTGDALLARHGLEIYK